MTHRTRGAREDRGMEQSVLCPCLCLFNIITIMGHSNIHIGESGLNPWSQALKGPQNSSCPFTASSDALHELLPMGIPCTNQVLPPFTPMGMSQSHAESAQSVCPCPRLMRLTCPGPLLQRQAGTGPAQQVMGKCLGCRHQCAAVPRSENSPY